MSSKYYGIDLHSDTMTVHMIKQRENGRFDPGKSFKLHLYTPTFDKFVESLGKEDKILIEASTTSYWFYDQVEGKVDGCYILNSNRLQYVALKTDKIDAIRLAHILIHYETVMTDPAQKPYIYVPTKEVRGLRSLFTTYKLHKKVLTQIKNRVHSLCKLNGIKMDRTAFNSKEKRERFVEAVELPGIYLVQIVDLFNSIDEMEKEEKRTKELIIREGYKLFPRQVEVLLSIKGFSPFTAVALMSDVCTIDRFETAKKFCSYLRSAPRVKASNNTVHLGKTNKCGRRLTVSLMSQSMIHFYSSTKHITDFKDRLRQGKSAGKVRMAVIRKILTSVFHMLKKDEPCYWADKSKYASKLAALKVLVECNQGKREERKAA